MSDLAALTALGGTAPKVETIGAVTLTEMPDVALASLAARLGGKAAMADAAMAYLGASLPGPGTAAIGATVGNPFTVWWSGVEQWMVEAPYASHELLADHLKAAVGAAGSVTEQSDGWVRFDLSTSGAGPGIPAILERLCPVDAHAMTAGATTRTVVEHLGCFILCREAGHLFSIYGPRASAGSLHHALVTAATSVARLSALAS